MFFSPLVAEPEYALIVVICYISTTISQHFTFGSVAIPLVCQDPSVCQTHTIKRNIHSNRGIEIFEYQFGTSLVWKRNKHRNTPVVDFLLSEFRDFSHFHMLLWFMKMISINMRTRVVGFCELYVAHQVTS